MSAKRTAWNEFNYSMALAVICLAIVLITNKVDDLSSHTTKYTSLTLTQKVFAIMRRIGKGFLGVETPLFATMLVQPQAAAEEEEEWDESHKVAALEQDKVTQALEIIKLKRRVKNLEKKRRSKRMHPNRGRIKAIDADEEITLVDMETHDDLGAELQERLEEKDDVNAGAKEVNAAKPTVFDDEEIAKRLHDEEVKQAAAREKQEHDDFKRAQELQHQKYQSLKRKPISIAQAMKNMIVYLKNMVRLIFEKEYNKVQTFLKPDRDEEPTKKEDTPTDDPKEMSKEDVQNMLQIVPVSEVGGITQACQSFEDMLKDFNMEDLDAL
uniref:Uncharacterized protein n=1 Tax=Tanacetum cinerariifolium TaxID=118510 RepID=A0A699IKA0_TANCI|nr:hypothetical protein [Tanacetum cinerariifolium]